jgi:DNA processing protein
MSEVKYWLWLTQLKKMGNLSAGKYVRHFGSVKKLYFAAKEEISLTPGATDAEIAALMNKDLAAAENIEAKCAQLGVEVLSVQDAAYPERLRNIYDAPLVIYVRGKLPAVDDEPCLAVVGTRRASPYGIKCAERISADMTRCGATVVSGLAEGIDSAAVKSALKAGGTPIGVLGTGIDVVFPAWNAELQSEVAKRGALVSEYPPGTRGSRSSFPARNRIISGLSVGVVVIEAPEKSGSLITAARAVEQGRDVFVVPGNIDAPGFAGSNSLIKDGAALITSGWEAVSFYRWRFPEKLENREKKNRSPLDAVRRAQELISGRAARQGEKKEVDKQKSMEYIDLKEELSLSPEQTAVLKAVAGGASSADEAIERTGLPAQEVLSAITLLELEGLVSASASGLSVAD